MSKKEYTHSIHIRTRYSETDQMGFVYYGRFAEFYEIGRVETIRSLGMAYKQLEEELKVLMPVMSMQVRYLRPALYDQELEVKTSVRQVPEDAIIFLPRFTMNQNSLSMQPLSNCAFWMQPQKKECPVQINCKN